MEKSFTTKDIAFNALKEKYDKTEEIEFYDNKFIKITYPNKYQEEIYIFVKNIVTYSYTRFSLIGPGFVHKDVDNEQVDSFYYSTLPYVLDYTRSPIITILSKEEFLKETERVYKFIINNLLKSISEE